MSVASRRRARGMWLLSGFGGGGAAPSYDTDAQTYITAVEAADGQSLETGVKDAINAFVVGCKSDGIWTAIKASCILAGARTLTGALVPLVGTAPTNLNFVSGDYDRKDGLTGDAATKRLTANRATADDPQDDCHLSLYYSTNAASTARTLGSFSTSPQVATMLLESGNACCRNYTQQAAPVANPTGFSGCSRNNSANFDIRSGGITANRTVASLAPSTNPSHYVFAVSFNGTTAINYSSSTISFYSIGESLDLALLDSRVSTLIAGMAFAVNTGLSPVGYSTETINYVNAGYAAGGTLA